METPREMPAAAWRVPAGGVMSPVEHGVVVASRFGSMVLGESGPRLRTPGWLGRVSGTWVSQVGPWSVRFDEAGTRMEDAVVGQVVAVDRTGVQRRVGGAVERVERRGDRTAVAWGPVLPGDGVVAGWSCARDPDTSAFAECREVAAPVEGPARVGEATWSFSDGTLTMWRGKKVVFQRDGIDEVLPVGDTLIVRAYAHDRPWVRYDDDGEAVSVLAPGEAVALDDEVWIYDEDRVAWFDRYD
jgi:hypothetical protein